MLHLVQLVAPEDAPFVAPLWTNGTKEPQENTYNLQALP
jgi:hypothetical protein